MASPAQIAANIANAQRSTGPRTEAGKNITSQNATTHGLCRSVAILDDDDPAEAQALLADLMEEHQPQGPTEEILVFKMAENFLLNKRASHYLAIHTMYNEGGKDEGDEDQTKQVSLYLRYYTTTDRAFNRNLFDLRKLQKERREQEAKSEIGSVSQNVEPPSAPSKNPAASAPQPPKSRPRSFKLTRFPPPRRSSPTSTASIGPSRPISDCSASLAEACRSTKLNLDHKCKPDVCLPTHDTKNMPRKLCLDNGKLLRHAQPRFSVYSPRLIRQGGPEIGIRIPV